MRKRQFLSLCIVNVTGTVIPIRTVKKEIAKIQRIYFIFLFILKQRLFIKNLKDLRNILIS